MQLVDLVRHNLEKRIAMLPLCYQQAHFRPEIGLSK